MNPGVKPREVLGSLVVPAVYLRHLQRTWGLLVVEEVGRGAGLIAGDNVLNGSENEVVIVHCVMRISGRRGVGPIWKIDEHRRIIPVGPKRRHLIRKMKAHSGDVWGNGRIAVRPGRLNVPILLGILSDGIQLLGERRLNRRPLLLYR